MPEVPTTSASVGNLGLPGILSFLLPLILGGGVGGFGGSILGQILAKKFLLPGAGKLAGQALGAIPGKAGQLAAKLPGSTVGRLGRAGTELGGLVGGNIAGRTLFPGSPEPQQGNDVEIQKLFTALQTPSRISSNNTNFLNLLNEQNQFGSLAPALQAIGVETLGVV